MRLIIAIALLMSAAGAPASDRLKRSAPDFAETIKTPYQAAFRNVRAALGKCQRFEPLFSGAVFTDTPTADLTVLQMQSGVTPLAHMEFDGSPGDATRITLWLAKPTFGSPLLEPLAKALPVFAQLGARADCAANGF